MRILTAKDLSFVKPARSIKYPHLREVVVPFIADIQYWRVRDKLSGEYMASPTVDLDKLKMTVERIRRMPNAYPVFGGDALDVMSPSNRRAWAEVGSRLYDSAQQLTQDAVLDAVDDMFDILSPLKGRILAWMTGHHMFDAFGGDNCPKEYHGKNTDEILAERLGAPYTSDGITVLHVPLGGGRETLILASHPDGWGVVLTASLNKVIRDVLPYHEFDIAAVAHYHRKLSASVPGIRYPVAGGTAEVTRKIVSMGSYMLSYVEGFTSYGERKLYPPLSTGSPFAFIRPLPNGRLDIEVEE